jgi:serine/threonine-protein kinase
VRDLQRLNETHATLLPDTAGASSPFFSPDGQQIAFFAANELKRISVAGGAPVTVCEVSGALGGSWGEDGTIVFAPDTGPGTVLWRVPSAGGKAEPVAPLGPGEWRQLSPQVLADGAALLYTEPTRPGTTNDANLVVQSLSNGHRKVVLQRGYQGRYLPSGHLLYMRDGTIFAAPFDLGRLETTGPAVSVLDGVASNARVGSAQLAVSRDGLLAYLPGANIGDSPPVQWLDQKGVTAPLWVPPGRWFNLHFAPDGKRLAMTVYSGAISDIWIYDPDRDAATPLTHHRAVDDKAVWTPDGQRIAFNSDRDGAQRSIYWQRTDGTGSAVRLTRAKNSQWPVSWHPSGKFLAFEEETSETSWDLMLLPMEGSEAAGWSAGSPVAFLNSPFAEKEPNFSPDGRWLAYHSNESGREEVYVRPFRGQGEGWRISTGGGSFPIWSRTRRELFFSVNGQVMVANYTVQGEAFHAEKPRLLANVRFTPAGPARMFDLHPDGERFAAAPATDSDEHAKRDRVVVILNFFDELQRAAPAR